MNAVNIETDWTALVALIGSVSFIGVVAWLAYKGGKSAVRNEINEKAAKDAKNQAEIFANPRDSDDSLSDGSF